MGKDHRGHPSGVNKSEGNTGIPGKLSPDDMPVNNENMGKYTDDDREISNNTREMHRNRNVDKTDATNAGGYRN